MILPQTGQASGWRVMGFNSECYCDPTLFSGAPQYLQVIAIAITVGPKKPPAQGQGSGGMSVGRSYICL
jgi:hypothetical protein